ncbi:MAG: hypothetical protein WCE22_04805 [Candidatus Aquirickettsiella gammari]
MFEALNEFQNAAQTFNPMTLVIPGVLCVILGIVIWLAGTKFTRILAIIFGFAGGAVGAFYLFPRHQAPATITAAVIGGLVVMVVHRFITAIAGIAILVIVGLAFFVGSYFNDRAAGVHSPEPAKVTVKLTPLQTAEQIKVRASNAADVLFVLVKRLPLMGWPAVAIAVVVLALLGIFLGRLIVAVGCSSLGTSMIFAGMVSLLLYKGSMPLTYIYMQSSRFCAIFFGMAVVGTISQMILCRPSKLKIVKEHEKEIEKKKHNPGEHKWTAH